MKYLLPHHFKKIGIIIAPLGFSVWLSMQLGLVTEILSYCFGTNQENDIRPPYYVANVVIAIVSFLCFLSGFYFVSFSKEKIEDEMVQRTRLDSFQFAALIQIIFIILGFSQMLFLKEPNEGGLTLFFITAIFLFWLCFVIRFNYVLHIRMK